MDIFCSLAMTGFSLEKYYRTQFVRCRRGEIRSRDWVRELHVELVEVEIRGINRDVGESVVGLSTIHCFRRVR